MVDIKFYLQIMISFICVKGHCFIYKIFLVSIVNKKGDYYEERQ